MSLGSSRNWREQRVDDKYVTLSQRVRHPRPHSSIGLPRWRHRLRAFY
jgi:hypothetical protein